MELSSSKPIVGSGLEYPVARHFTIATVLALIVSLSFPTKSARSEIATGVLIGGGVAVALLIGSAFDDSRLQHEPDVVTYGAGVFDPFQTGNTAGIFRIEYRPEIWGWRFGPLIGIEATTDGGIVGYGGIRHDIPAGERWLLSLSFALAGYRKGGGKDLGAVGQFRSGIDIFYKFENGTRLGGSFHHLSHAEIFGITSLD